MELIVQQGEREETVRIETLQGAEAGRYEITVGERTYRVEAARLSKERRGGRWSLRVEGDGETVSQHEVSAWDEKDGSTRISTRAGLDTVTMTDPLTHLARQAQAASGAGGGQVVTAYMPGRVVSVLAQEGDEVTAGQGIVVLEAMKMENEIAADAAGTLKKIYVEAGQSVDGGDKLFEVE